jgi:predicted small lipoprotein YifL
MKTKKFFALLLALSMLLGMVACGGEKVPTDIPNGDFEAEHETGKWTGWTREDAAFNVRGLVGDEKISGAVMEKSGDYYFAGSIGGNPPCAVP